MKFTWIPGHAGIEGNKIADMVAKGIRNKRIDMGGRCIEMDYEEDSSCLIREWKKEEWLKWHMDQGHEYYERTPRKPKHLKELPRLDCYVLMRLRLGADKRGQENCKNESFRHHPATCNRYQRKRSERHTLYDDKYLKE